eukprot:635550-Pelagomonas_calceolata.AAC.4
MGLDLFHAQGEASSLPVTVQANIEEGRLYFFGKELPLPIKGKGLFTILYIDDKVRIFRSGKSYAVQRARSSSSPYPQVLQQGHQADGRKAVHSPCSGHMRSQLALVQALHASLRCATTCTAPILVMLKCSASSNTCALCAIQQLFRYSFLATASATVSIHSCSVA